MRLSELGYEWYTVGARQKAGLKPAKAPKKQVTMDQETEKMLVEKLTQAMQRAKNTLSFPTTLEDLSSKMSVKVKLLLPFLGTSDLVELDPTSTGHTNRTQWRVRLRAKRP